MIQSGCLGCGTLCQIKSRGSHKTQTSVARALMATPGKDSSNSAVCKKDCFVERVTFELDLQELGGFYRERRRKKKVGGERGGIFLNSLNCANVHKSQNSFFVAQMVKNQSLLRSTGSRTHGLRSYGLYRAVEDSLNCPENCAIILDQGSKRCPMHWQADSSSLSHQGSPLTHFFFLNQIVYFLVAELSSIFKHD